MRSKPPPSGSARHVRPAAAPSPAHLPHAVDESAGKVVTVLAISPLTEDHARLDEIFHHSRWHLHHARDCEEAMAFLRRHRVGVIISESDLNGLCWKNVYHRVLDMPESPKPRVVVTSTFADDLLWSEVLNLGAYNVLAKPFDSKEVFWVVSHAWLDWKRELEHGSVATVAAAAG